jgi:hypothetical protein
MGVTVGDKINPRDTWIQKHLGVTSLTFVTTLLEVTSRMFVTTHLGVKSRTLVPTQQRKDRLGIKTSRS